MGRPAGLINYDEYMNKSILTAFVGCMSLLCSSASAQTASGSQDYLSGFDAVEVSDYFTVRIVHDDYYGAEWVIEDDLRDAMHVYVRGNTLVASLDRKALSAEVKKKYSGKKIEKAVMNVTVHTPGFKTLTVSGNAAVNLDSYRVSTGEMIVNMDDNASVSGLDIYASSFTLSASKKSRIESSEVSADNISVNTFNSAFVRMNQKSKTVSLQVNGTSDLYVTGESETLDVTALNYSRLRLEGSTATLNLNAGNREIHAEKLNANYAVVTGSNSCKADISVSDSLSLDLKGGCTVNFAGSPAIEIVRIQNSSVGHLTY